MTRARRSACDDAHTAPPDAGDIRDERGVGARAESDAKVAGGGTVERTRARGMPGARACAALLSLVWLLASSPSDGQAAPRQLLEGLEIGREGGAALLRVRFSVPVRYLRHAPSRRGAVIHVRVDPLALPGSAAALPSEVLRAPPGAGLPLLEGGYAADGGEGRVL